MKYLIIVSDGAAGEPLNSIGGKTTLEKANIPHMDLLAREGELGKVRTIPPGVEPGSDAANMSVLGYSPLKYLKGRSSLEAESMGIKLGENDISFRVNLVHLDGENKFENKTMVSHSSNDIPTNEATILIEKLSEKLSSEQIKFYPGVSYRNLLVIRNADYQKFSGLHLVPPHDILGEKLSDYVPNSFDPAGSLIRYLDEKGEEILRDLGNFANAIWIWGMARKTQLPDFTEKTGLKGSVISAVDLIKGLGISAGLKPINVEGATGTIETNFSGKANSAIKEFKDGKDFVFIHIEAPDESAHNGNIKDKIKSLELIDEKIVKPLYEYLENSGDEFKIMILPDHKTPIEIRTHSNEPVPYLIFDSRKTEDSKNEFNERMAEKTDNRFDSGPSLFDHFINL